MATLAEMLRQGSFENPNNPYSSNLLANALRGSVSNAESLGRGAAVAPLGIFGDVNALAREYITPRLPAKVQAALESLPAAPTTEAILANIPRGTEARRESSGMEQLGAAMNPMGPIEAAKGVTKGLGAYGKLAGEAVNDAMIYGRGPLAEITPQPMRMVEQTKSTFKFPQEEAMKLAQQRAALPVQQGGLGLLENNTAAEREAAMFPLKAYRGVTGDVESSVMPSDFFGSNYFGKGINITTSPKDASKYASTDVGVNHDLVGKAELMSQKLGISYPEAKAELTRGGGAVMPISANIDNPLVVGMQKIQAPDSMIRYALNEAGYSGNIDKLVNQFKNANTGIEQFKLMQENQATPFYRSMSSLMKKNGLMIDPSLSPKSEGGMHYLATDPEQIRSRFAAFDPFRKTAATAAAMGVAAPDLLAKERK